MIHPTQFLTSDDIKSIQRGLILQSEDYAIGQNREHLQHRVHRIRDAEIRRVIRAMPPFELKEFRAAWSLHMALFSGRHLFPDANHRTALMSFNRILFSASWNVVKLAPGAAREMVARSKKMRDAFRVGQSPPRYYSIAELSDSGHPYRALFRQYEAAIELLAADRYGRVQS